MPIVMTPAGEPLFPTAVTRGAVYIVRDPRAVAVSFANHLAETIDETIVRMDDPAAYGLGRSRSVAPASATSGPARGAIMSNRGAERRFRCICCAMRICTAIRMAPLPPLPPFLVCLAMAIGLRPRSTRRAFPLAGAGARGGLHREAERAAGVLPRRSLLTAGGRSLTAGAGNTHRGRKWRCHAAV